MILARLKVVLLGGLVLFTGWASQFGAGPGPRPPAGAPVSGFDIASRHEWMAAADNTFTPIPTATAVSPSPSPSAALPAPAPTAARPAPAPTALPPAAGCGPFVVPSAKGLNYGMPGDASGGWLGTSWLRPENWPGARGSLDADMGYIQSHGLGRVVRIFVGLDQLMNWEPNNGFVSFNEASMVNFQQAMAIIGAHGLRAIVVLYDQEEVSNPGNFKFQALDGRHPAMRAGYLKATGVFLARFGCNPTVIGWDLFNEAYNALGTRGGLPPPGGADPVSPGYPDQTVHAFIRDLYRTAKAAAPGAWFTVSDATDLYWPDSPNISLYSDSVDFYDMHLYDNHPATKAIGQKLGKPLVIGEMGADAGSNAFLDQSVNPPVLSSILKNLKGYGAVTALAHMDQGNIFGRNRGPLTPSGQVIAAFAG